MPSWVHRKWCTLHRYTDVWIMYELQSCVIFTDINECAEESTPCLTNAICQNTPGSFTCACQEGYDGDGQTTPCTSMYEIPYILKKQQSYTVYTCIFLHRCWYKITYNFGTSCEWWAYSNRCVCCHSHCTEVQVKLRCTHNDLIQCT